MQLTKEFAKEVIDKGIILGSKEIKDKTFEIDFIYYYYEDMFFRVDECKNNNRIKINEMKLFDVADELLLKLIDSKKIISKKTEKDDILSDLNYFIKGNKNINVDVDCWSRGGGLTVQSEYENCELVSISKDGIIKISTEDGLIRIKFDDNVGFIYDDSIENYYTLKVCSKMDERSYNVVTIRAYNSEYNDFNEDMVKYMNNRLVLK